MSSKKQTAVEWLVDELEQHHTKIDIKNTVVFQQAKAMEKEQIIKNITDYNVKVTEFLHNPLFNLEHSKHGIACEKLADIRNKFINEL